MHCTIYVYNKTTVKHEIIAYGIWNGIYNYMSENDPIMAEKNSIWLQIARKVLTQF